MRSIKWPNGVNTDCWSLLWIATLDHGLTVQLLTELLPPIQYCPKMMSHFQ